MPDPCELELLEVVCCTTEQSTGSLREQKMLLTAHPPSQWLTEVFLAHINPLARVSHLQEGDICESKRYVLSFKYYD